VEIFVVVAAFEVKPASVSRDDGVGVTLFSGDVIAVDQNADGPGLIGTAVAEGAAGSGLLSDEVASQQEEKNEKTELERAIQLHRPLDCSGKVLARFSNDRTSVPSAEVGGAPSMASNFAG